MKTYNNIMDIIGNTPLLELVNIEKKYNLKAKIYAKLEFLNPAGSIKDRVARQMILDAEQKGILKNGATIIEPTSGNTGIGLACICASKGYKMIVVMPDNMSIERIKIMQGYGAFVVLTPGKLGMKGSIEKAISLQKEIPGSFIAGQFDNPSNPLSHENTTAKEIYEDTDGLIDIFVAGIGTGGTISGCGKYLKSMNDNIKVVGVEPQSSPFLTKGVSGPHEIQGIGAGFKPEILDLGVIDDIKTVSNEDSISKAKEAARLEGLLVGISSGAALKAAIDLALEDENKDKKIVVIFPDTGQRYLSTKLFS